jgi:hypothetical protein
VTSETIMNAPGQVDRPHQVEAGAGEGIAASGGPWAAVGPDLVQAYGMQREICLRATLDADGNPRVAPLDPVGATLRVTGPLSLPHLCQAIELVAARAEVLRGRLRRGADGFVLVREPGRPEVPVITVDLRGRALTDQQNRMAYLFRHSTDLLFDMQDGPPGLIVVAILDDQDHVLYARFDHAHVDQQAMHAWLRRVGRTYGRLVDGDDPTEELAAWHAADFFSYAGGIEADSAGRRAADEFWRPAVRDSQCEFALPGRSWRPWQERRSTENLSWDMPEADARALTEARRTTGASQMFLYIAALSVVIAGATGTEFVPMTYHRHGVENAEPLIGPLWDTFITIAQPDPADTLAPWVTDFATVNAQVPSMRGLALVDFASLDKVMELRRFTINVLLPGRPLFLGKLRAVPYTPVAGMRDPIAAAKKIKNNVGIRLFALGAGKFRATLNYDPDDFADRERIFTAACHVVRRVVERPGMSLAEARAEALSVLRDEPVR